MPDGRGRRNVCELDTTGGAPQHQRAAAHVAAADEVHRIVQPVAEDRAQYIDVFSRCDAAEQNDQANEAI